MATQSIFHRPIADGALIRGHPESRHGQGMHICLAIVTAPCLILLDGRCREGAWDENSLLRVYSQRYSFVAARRPT